MAKTHYEVLGVAVSSTDNEIRSAYRKLVFAHHPDRSSDPNSKAIFLAVTEAYEVVGDRDRRREYDARLQIEQKVREQRANSASGGQARSASARLAEVRLDVNRLSTLFARGNYFEAEKLARSILERDRRQPVAYAVLGDIAKMSGNKSEALRMYSQALHFDPKNPVFQRRHHDLIEPTVAVTHVTPSPARRPVQKTSPVFAPMFGLGLILIACVYILFSHETPIFPSLKFISTWTLGLIAMLFFGGVVAGSCLSLDGLLENFFTDRDMTSGGVSPTAALATIAIVNFWAAVAMYGLIGIKRGSYNQSASRIIATVIAGTCLLALASEASETISGVQVFLWGGNLVYLGAICGWMVTDALKNASR